MRAAVTSLPVTWCNCPLLGEGKPPFRAKRGFFSAFNENVRKNKENDEKMMKPLKGGRR